MLYGGILTSAAAALLRLGALSPSRVEALRYNVTAIGAFQGVSTLECWQLDTALTVSADAGTAGSARLELGGLSTTSNLSYVVIPPRFDGGLHTAPANQWVVFLSGLAVITLPGSTESAYVSGGEFGLIFAADTANVSTIGHRTQYPGVTPTIALQIPTRNGLVPNHSKLHAGSCAVHETAGLRGLALQGL